MGDATACDRPATRRARCLTRLGNTTSADMTIASADAGANNCQNIMVAGELTDRMPAESPLMLRLSVTERSVFHLDIHQLNDR